MPQSQVIVTYSQAKLTPCYSPGLAKAKPVNLAPSVTYPAGQVLLWSGVAVNAVQTITAPGSGTYTISGTNPLTGTSWTTAALAFGANDAAVLAAIIAVWGLGGSGITVVSLAVTFAGLLAGRPIPPLTTSAGSVAQTTAGQTANAYSAYNAAGSGSPSLLLEYGCTTDTAGNITTSNLIGQSQPTISAFMSGFFNLSDIVGLDANAVTKMGGAIVSGSIASGVGTFKF
jgi:hypothetical protein